MSFTDNSQGRFTPHRMATQDPWSYMLSLAVEHRAWNDPLFKDGLNTCSPLIKVPCVDLDEEEFLHSKTEPLRCSVVGCRATFTSLVDQASHQRSAHTHVCSTCRHSLPTHHLLDLHLLETHDSLFQVMAERRPMYQCFLETCSERFMDPAERKGHCLKRHKFPADFRFDTSWRKMEKKKGKQQKGESLMDCDTTRDAQTKSTENPDIVASDMQTSIATPDSITSDMQTGIETPDSFSSDMQTTSIESPDTLTSNLLTGIATPDNLTSDMQTTSIQNPNNSTSDMQIISLENPDSETKVNVNEMSIGRYTLNENGRNARKPNLNNKTEINERKPTPKIPNYFSFGSGVARGFNRGRGGHRGRGRGTVGYLHHPHPHHHHHHQRRTPTKANNKDISMKDMEQALDTEMGK